MPRPIICFTTLAIAITLAPAATAYADPCPPNPAPSAILDNCTFRVPSSVKAKDQVKGPVTRIVNTLIDTVFEVKKFAGEPVTSKSIKDDSIELADLSPSLRATLTAPPAPTPAPTPAPAPAVAGPLGYARVNANGSVDPAASKNIEFVSAIGGIYCLRYTAGEPHVINLTVDISGADGRKVIVAGTAVKSAIDGGGACGASANIEVVTSTATTQSDTPAPFYLVVAA